jgi:signal transduction histidine kinase
MQPVAGILGMTELLGGTALDPEQLDYVKAIHESGKLLLTVISDVLDFSRIEAGKLQLECIPFRARSVIGHVAGLMNEIARSKRVDLAVAVAPDVPAILRGDPERLKQCL